MEIDEERDYILIYQAAKFLGVCVQTLRNWHREGKFIPSKVNECTGRRYYLIEDLKKFKKIMKKIKYRKLG